MARTTGKPAQVVEGTFDEGGYGSGFSDAAFDDEPRGGSLQPLPRAGAPLVRVAAEAITAIQVPVPRDMKKVRDGVVQEAALMADTWCYAWQVNDRHSPTGKSTIRGPSIDAAMVLLRRWGNSTVTMALEDETPTHWIFRATFIDYEQGFALPRLFRQRKAQTTGGKMNAEREMDIAFQIGQSKAQRNAVIKGIPAWLQASAERAVEAAASERFADLPKAAALAEAAFGKMGVTVPELERWIGKPRAQWTALDHVRLSQVRRAILDGVSNVDAEFRGTDTTSPPGEEQPAPSTQGDQAGDAQPAAPTQPGQPGPAKPSPKPQREPGSDDV